MDEPYSIEAELETIIYQSDGNYGGAYMVGEFVDLKDNRKFTANGSIHKPEEGMKYVLYGREVKTRKYGTQFKIISSDMLLPTSRTAFVKFFSSRRFKGIGPKTAEKMYDAYGSDSIDILFQNPKKLEEDGIIPASKMTGILEGIENMPADSSTIRKLFEFGVSEKKIRLLEDFYKNRLELVMSQNPFDPYYRVPGFGYQDTLRIADGVGIDFSDSRRLDIWIAETIRNNAYRTGDMYLHKPVLMQALSMQNTIPKEEIEEALRRLELKKRIKVEQDRVYPWNLYDDECQIASEMAHRVFKVTAPDENTLSELISLIEQKEHITYDPIQKQAMKTFLDHSCMILNGGPGTGKSTTVKGILDLIEMLYGSQEIMLAAPTGRASKRLSQLSGMQARTLHSLLKWDPSTGHFGALYSGLEEEPDFMIIDECSMMDSHIFSVLLQCLPVNCRLLLIGDEDQLESVAPGRVFNDLIDSKKIPMVSLETVFRQKEGSGIAAMAYDIRNNRIPKFEDGVFFESVQAENISDILETMVNTRDSLEGFQILAPKYKGTGGINEINARMQELLNPFHPNKVEIRVGETIWREGDKVLLKKNLTEQEVFNGDIGTITQVVTEPRAIEVTFDEGVAVNFTTDINEMLSHAWCVSVHKAQGSEYQHVIFICTEQAEFMLRKQLIYTAISRAKKRLDILGSLSAFQKGLVDKEIYHRKTTLKERLAKAMD